MHNYVHVIRLHLRREGVSASALFVSPDVEDYRPLIELAKSMGIEAEVEADPAPLCKVDGVIDWMKQFDREQTPEPAVVRGEYEERLNELTRAQRNTDRKLDRIAELLADALEQKTRPAQPERVGVPPGVPDPNPRRYGVPDDAVAPATEAQLDEQLARPTPFFEHGESTQQQATRNVMNQITGAGGVLPGNVTPSVGASSEAWGVGTDGNGRPAAVRIALPVVGDSLKPPGMR